MTEPNPLPAPADGEVVYIGRIYTPWQRREDCPRNVRQAREAGGAALVEVEPIYRPGLFGLERHSHVILLYWMDQAERDALIQFPRHTPGPRGVFSIRSPARPNPIALAVARILAIEPETGRIEVEQLDCLSGTPLIDVKPYLPSVDSRPEAETDLAPASLLLQAVRQP